MGGESLEPASEGGREGGGEERHKKPPPCRCNRPCRTVPRCTVRRPPSRNLFVHLDETFCLADIVVRVARAPEHEEIRSVPRHKYDRQIGQTSRAGRPAGERDSGYDLF